MAPPSTLPLWATNASTTTEPTLGKKQAGWVAAEKPPAKWLNWWMNLVYQWIVYYGEKDAANGIVGLGANTQAAWTATGGNAAGATITGHGSGQGVVAVGGATSGTGLQGTGGAPNGIGVLGYGDGTGAGGYFTGGDSSGSGLVAIGGASNGNGVLGYGDGTGAGLVGTGGDSSGVGVDGYGGASNGIGVRGTGDGTGQGVYGVGGDSSGVGVDGYGGSSNGIGVRGTGSGTGVGGYFDGAGSGTGASDDAIYSAQNIRMAGSNPSVTTGFSNRLTPMNVPKAWGLVTSATSGSGGTLTNGFNVASIARQSAGVHRITFATAMANADYAVVMPPCAKSTYVAVPQNKTTGYFDIAIAAFSTGTDTDVALTLQFDVFGAQ